MARTAHDEGNFDRPQTPYVGPEPGQDTRTLAFPTNRIARPRDRNDTARDRRASVVRPGRGAKTNRLARGAAALCALLFVASSSGCGSEDRVPRTVVLVVVDTLRSDDEAALPRSADYENFVERATAHRHAFASTGWTLPSVASILTGLDPEVHGAYANRSRVAPLSADATTLAEAFRAEGWRTVAVTNAAFLSPALGLDRGFEIYDHQPAFHRDVRRARPTVARALTLAEEAEGEDLFLLVHLFDPHLDYDPTAEARAALEDRELAEREPVSLDELRALEKAGPSEAELDAVRTLHRLEIRAALEAVGALHAALDAREGPLVFTLTADHGEEFHDHGGFEHGHTLHTELVHVPLRIDAPGADGGDRDGIVSTRDLGRRLLALADVPVPESFAPSTSDWDGTGGGVAYSSSTLYGPDRIALRTDERALLIELSEGETGATYDLATDPREQSPLPVEADLREQLFERRRANRDTAREMSYGDWIDLAPSRAKDEENAELLRSLESLGYTDSREE